MYSDATECIAWSKERGILESFHGYCDWEPIQIFTILIFISETRFMWNIHLLHLCVYYSLSLLLIVDKLCCCSRFLFFVVFGNCHYSILQPIKSLHFSLLTFLSVSGVLHFLLFALFSFFASFPTDCRKVSSGQVFVIWSCLQFLHIPWPPEQNHRPECSFSYRTVKEESTRGQMCSILRVLVLNVWQTHNLIIVM